ncbi:hypothetical protein GCM10010172_52230 [Paractinoplanes ferrugineus]|uniref:Uncharacterized protein n=1 Tax=Paractinoplanes ferrugineus TaxID=113564 RepID=A0A919MDP3_9ACTN|nr:hypothetical protein Afe05nite_37980 [Actinoplanes ferrugineus]
MFEIVFGVASAGGVVVMGAPAITGDLVLYERVRYTTITNVFVANKVRSADRGASSGVEKPDPVVAGQSAMALRI